MHFFNVSESYSLTIKYLIAMSALMPSQAFIFFRFLNFEIGIIETYEIIQKFIQINVCKLTILILGRPSTGEDIRLRQA